MTPERLTVADATTLDALTDLCMRSKAHWGYDAAFMQACAPVLRVTGADLAQPTAVVRVDGRIAGMVRVDLSETPPQLCKLFVAPEFMRRGVGAALIGWAKATAHTAGHHVVRIESDPGAVPFYAAQGAYPVGDVASDAIPGRRLPLLELPTPAM